MVSEVDRDELEDDWEILRRDPDEAAFPTTLSMAEAVERICKALVDYEIHSAGQPETVRKQIQTQNLFPVFSIIPFFDVNEKKHLWKVLVTFDLADMKFSSDPEDCCEKAVENLFRYISKVLAEKAKLLHSQADSQEADATFTRGQARKVDRIGKGMGTYSLIQPNLPMKVEP